MEKKMVMKRRRRRRRKGKKGKVEDLRIHERLEAEREVESILFGGGEGALEGEGLALRRQDSRGGFSSGVEDDLRISPLQRLHLFFLLLLLLLLL
jgi:hypothetical protein